MKKLVIESGDYTCEDWIKGSGSWLKSMNRNQHAIDRLGLSLLCLVFSFQIWGSEKWKEKSEKGLYMKKEKMMNKMGDDLYGGDWVGCGDEDGWLSMEVYCGCECRG